MRLTRLGEIDFARRTATRALRRASDAQPVGDGVVGFSASWQAMHPAGRRSSTARGR